MVLYFTNGGNHASCWIMEAAQNSSILINLDYKSIKLPDQGDLHRFWHYLKKNLYMYLYYYDSFLTSYRATFNEMYELCHAKTCLKAFVIVRLILK